MMESHKPKNFTDYSKQLRVLVKLGELFLCIFNGWYELICLDELHELLDSKAELKLALQGKWLTHDRTFDF
jgi:hypothetical protein